jgi:hypothetical protein
MMLSTAASLDAAAKCFRVEYISTLATALKRSRISSLCDLLRQ